MYPVSIEGAVSTFLTFLWKSCQNSDSEQPAAIQIVEIKQNVQLGDFCVLSPARQDYWILWVKRFKSVPSLECCYWYWLFWRKEGQGEKVKKKQEVVDYLLLLPLVFQGPVPWYPLLHLTQLVLHLSVQVEQAGPQRPRLLGVLQVQGGRHDPQRLEQAGLDTSQRTGYDRKVRCCVLLINTFFPILY